MSSALSSVVGTAIGSLDRITVERIVRDIVLRSVGTHSKNSVQSKLVVSISARHCHLTDEHVEKLFGPGHRRKTIWTWPQTHADEGSLSNWFLCGRRNRDDRGTEPKDASFRASPWTDTKSLAGRVGIYRRYLNGYRFARAGERKNIGHPRLRAGGACRGN